jgi:hypothetical protein
LLENHLRVGVERRLLALREVPSYE